jgi:hypothetical protein
MSDFDQINPHFHLKWNRRHTLSRLRNANFAFPSPPEGEGGRFGRMRGMSRTSISEEARSAREKSLSLDRDQTHSSLALRASCLHSFARSVVRVSEPRSKTAGRRNRYVVNWRRRLRHPLERHRTIGELMEALKAD